MLLGVIKGDYTPGQRSSIDNKILKDLPEKLSWSAIRENLEEYLSDRIAGRRFMIFAYQNSLYHGLNTLVHPIYRQGIDGYIFGKIQPKMSDAFYQNCADYIERLSQYLKARGVDFLYFIAPSKDQIYSDKDLPWIYNGGGACVTEPYVNFLNERGIRFLFPKTEFINERRKRPVFNWKYDANHWNEYGAFLGHSLIYAELQKTWPDLLPLKREDFTETKELQRYLPVSEVIVNEEVPVYTLKSVKARSIPLCERDLNYENRPPVYYKNSLVPNALRILIFAGSYWGFHDGIKYYVNNFSETALVYSYPNLKDIEYFVNFFEPDIVLVANAAYVVNTDYLFMPSRMAQTRLAQWSDLSLKQEDESPLVSEEKVSVGDISVTLTGVSLTQSGKPGRALFLRVGQKFFPAIYKTNAGEEGHFSLTLQKRTLKGHEDVDLILIDGERRLRPFKWTLPASLNEATKSEA